MLTNSAINPNKIIISQHNSVEVLKDTYNNQLSLHATVNFYEEEIVSDFYAGTTQSFATYLTIQVDIEKHITLLPEFLKYINHSCSPNVFFDTTSMKLICLKSILPGEELTFFYPSTEWDMAQPFNCICGNNNCLQLIKGAAHISEKILKQYRLSDFIKQKLSS